MVAPQSRQATTSGPCRRAARQDQHHWPVDVLPWDAFTLASGVPRSVKLAPHLEQVKSCACVLAIPLHLRHRADWPVTGVPQSRHVGLGRWCLRIPRRARIWLTRWRVMPNCSPISRYVRP